MIPDMKNLTLVVLLLLSSACSPAAKTRGGGDCPDPADERLTATFTVDDEFSSAELSWISDSLRDWSEATSGRADLRMEIASTSYSDMVPRTVSRVGYVPGDDRAAGITSGLGLDVIAISVQMEIEPEYEAFFRVSIAHEIGHYLGLPHAEKGCIMYKTATYSVSNDILVPQQCDVEDFDTLYP